MIHEFAHGERAIVDIQKLRAYCLNPHHTRGRYKARVFASVGILVSDAEELRTALLQAATNAEAGLGMLNSYGQRYIIDFEMFRQSRTVKIRSTWIVLTGQDLPWLTSCYVLLKEGSAWRKLKCFRWLPCSRICRSTAWSAAR